MTDPLFGSIWTSQATINVRDDRNAQPEDPKVLVDVGGTETELNLAQLAKLMGTLRQAHETLTFRKEQATLNRTRPLF